MAAGISYPDFIDLHVKRAMIDATRSVHPLADSEKSGKREFAMFGAIEKIDYLITDTGLEQKYVDWIKENGIEIIYACGGSGVDSDFLAFVLQTYDNASQLRCMECK